MAAAAESQNSKISPELAELRLLTEVTHLLVGMEPGGEVPPDVLVDVQTNLETAVYEMAMPLAVSTTVHRVEHHESEFGDRRRVITWLGKNAVANAEEGKRYYQSPAAHLRADIEVAEARHAQDNMRPGIAHVFLSPKMTSHDAPLEIAKAENLYAEDSLRVSYAMTDSQGEVVARRMESLLVSDVPLKAWIAMLKDPHNIFGKSFDLTNEQSALSVMELFKDLELQEEVIPDGPVTLVAAVLPYLDAANRLSVQKQLDGFRSDQALYKRQAERTAREWLAFDLELARSLYGGTATLEVKRFIAKLQHNWAEADLLVINNHQLEDNEYIMTKELAAVLEHAQQNILNSIAAVATGNEKVLAQLDNATVTDLQDRIKFIAILRDNNASEHEIAVQQSELARRVAGQNIDVGGGCVGVNEANFRHPDDSGDQSQSELDKKNWKWKIGKCQVKACPSPSPTEVGPCSVCRRCQSKFDAGDDPTKPGLFSSVTKRLEKALFKSAVELKSDDSQGGSNDKEGHIAAQVNEVFKQAGVESFEIERAKQPTRQSQQIAELALKS